MIVAWCIAGVLIAYLFFVFFPGACSLLSAYGRAKPHLVTEKNAQAKGFGPYYEKMLKARERILSLNPRRVYQTSFDGKKLAAEYIKGSSGKAVIFVHGFRAEPLMQFGIMASDFYDMGYSILIIHQRAHGESEGRYSGVGLREYRDVLGWIDVLKEQGEKRIVLYGMSMGATTVGFSVDKLPNNLVKCAIMDCGFESPEIQMMRDGRKWHMPMTIMMPPARFTAKILLKINLRESVEGHLAGAKVPVFFLHGTADRGVPVSVVDKLYNACTSDKGKIIAAGADHTISYMAAGDEIQTKLITFINKYMEE